MEEELLSIKCGRYCPELGKKGGFPGKTDLCRIDTDEKIKPSFEKMSGMMKAKLLKALFSDKT